MSGDYSGLRARIVDVPDFPRAGILFRDITPLLADGKSFALAVEGLAGLSPEGVGVVASPEARGFVFGAAVASRMGAGFALIRKRGKLPRATLRAAYDLEYGQDAIFMHADSLTAGTRVFLVDDLLATGGTLSAAAALVARADCVAAGAACVIELTALGGRGKLNGIPFGALVRY